MKIKDIMTKDVTTVNQDDTIEKTASLMKQFNVGSIPVCDNGKIIGIVTDRDITLRSTADGENSKHQKVCEIMSSNPITGTPEMNVDDAVRIMSEKKIRRLPVIENNNLVGIVALGDISVEPKLQDNAEEALNHISQPNSTWN